MDDEQGRKKKIGTPEQRAARKARTEARLRELNAHIERITAELEARRRAASSDAS